VGIDLVRHGLTPGSAYTLAAHLASEKRDSRYKARRPALQALLAFDLYWRLHRKYRLVSALPAVLAQDVWRLTAIGLAVVADALWVAPMLGIFVGNLFGIRETAEFSIYLWGLSALVSAAMLAVKLRVAPHHSGILDWWHTSWPARVRFGSFISIGQIGYIFMTLAAVITAGSVAAAGIRGALTLFGPIATLLSAMPMVFIPHAACTGNSLGDQWRLLSRTSLATSVLTLVAAGCAESS
jgi:hypothetical protein